MNDKDDHAREQAVSQLDSIKGMIERLEHAQQCTEDNDCTEGADGGDTWNDRNEYHDEDSARQHIEETPLSVQIRSGWHDAGSESDPEEFEILLCTGGPACRIIGALDEHRGPERPRLQYQDWGTPWNEYITTGDDQAALLAYCQAFYFGE